MVTSAVVLSPLPNIALVALLLSGVEKSLMKEACQVASALQSTLGYYGLSFPLGRMEATEWRRLLHLLAAAPVRVVWGGVMIPQESITEEERMELSNLAETLWGCKVYRGSDEVCFDPYYP
ncbi:uncharacterized protein LOC123507131 [Portunus trituberculatus]|uniref:uncharacterized protein LOC123507131 n=1 Tax=Portunus trituberculatus TaxID=210409 RepID=UPI001E1D20A0|nr:uncharacterized protein LOC123507131 [Portunus trituberculatus]